MAFVIYSLFTPRLYFYRSLAVLANYTNVMELETKKLNGLLLLSRFIHTIILKLLTINRWLYFAGQC